MISHFIIIGLISTGFVTVTDNQYMEYDWVESCYGIECVDPQYDDGISYWNYQFNI